MATFWRHECDTCGYAFETSGPHEFFMDADGKPADYGHPLAKSHEAESAGISGFYGRMWCLNLDRSVDVVIREFVHAVGRYDDIWSPGAHPEKTVEIVCPDCGDGSPVMGDLPHGESIPCPKCGDDLICTVIKWS